MDIKKILIPSFAAVASIPIVFAEVTPAVKATMALIPTESATTQIFTTNNLMIIGAVLLIAIYIYNKNKKKSKS